MKIANENVQAIRIEVKALALLFTLAFVPMLGYAAELEPGPIAGNTVYLGKARGYAFCEFEVVMGTPPNLVVQIYNTSGQQECSPAQFDPIDVPNSFVCFSALFEAIYFFTRSASNLALVV